MGGNTLRVGAAEWIVMQMKILIFSVILLSGLSGCSRNDGAMAREMLFVRELPAHFVSVSLDHAQVGSAVFGGEGFLRIEVREVSNAHYHSFLDDYKYEGQYGINIVSELVDGALVIREVRRGRKWVVDLKTGRVGN